MSITFPGAQPPSHIVCGDTLRRSVQLAKLYGISAFCFVYPSSEDAEFENLPEQFRVDAQLDLGYCVYWSPNPKRVMPEDDLSFISQMAPYFLDRRYLRVGGRPVLLVGCPGLLPDVVATTERWRAWCDANGVGSIFLVYSPSGEIDRTKPRAFNGVVVFPSADTHTLSVIGTGVRPSVAVCQGQSRNLNAFGDPSEGVLQYDYPVFQSIGPSGSRPDQDRFFARRLDWTPLQYRDLLENAAIYANPHFESETSLVFLNSWNNLGGGACLDPVGSHGYAYLEATRQALRLSMRRRAAAFGSGEKIALVIHVFYVEVFQEILSWLKKSNLRYDLFITCPPALRNHIETLLCDAAIEGAVVSISENRGRDIAAFLDALFAVEARGYTLLLKLHTKRSLHRADGDIWRKEIYSKLLSSDRAETALNALRGSGGFGILGPEGSVVSLGYYGGSNMERVRAMAEAMGVVSLAEKQEAFVAGTMFYARVDAFQPLRQLALGPMDFEPETGQIDGTLAHVIERAISYSALAAGYRVGEVAMSAQGLRAIVPDVAQVRLAFTDLRVNHQD